jgi:cell division protease FtsH
VFDELDSFASARGMYVGSGVEHSMVNQLLTEMDGFRREELVFVIGTTNFSEALDPALLRPGRFEFIIHVPYPGDDDRREILKIYRDRFRLDLSDELLEKMVQKTGGFVHAARGIRFSGDHLCALCRALNREKIRRGGHFPITEADLNEALTQKKLAPVTLEEEEELRIACHEAGHATCAALLRPSLSIQKVSIAAGEEGTLVLGYVQELFRETKYLTATKSELLDDICVLLGGRIAEQMILGDVSVGAANDLQRASEWARIMVEELGMGEQVGLRSLAAPYFDDGRGRPRPQPSTELAAQIDADIHRLLQSQHDRATQLLHDHRPLLEEMMARLLTEKVLEKEEVEEMVERHREGREGE